MAGGHDPAAEAGAYEGALARHGIRDVQPAYRGLLRRLKAKDVRLYEEAVHRYETDERARADADSDPLLGWIRYGAWLAEQVAAGRLVAIQRSGRARDPTRSPPLGEMLLHLPDRTGERSMVIAFPVEPSPAQEAARQLLCR